MIKLEANITRLAPRLGFRYDVERDKKSREESYRFEMISPGYYLCITEDDKAYAISETQKTMGCACKDMTYRCKPPYDVCKHLIAFARLPDVPTAPLSPIYEQLLRAAGWTGSNLHPPTKKKKLPNIHDPARKPGKQAATRAEQHKRYASMTPEEIIRETPQAKLETYATRGAPMAIKEVQRRLAEGA